MAKFKVLQGTVIHEKVTYTPGQTITTDKDLRKIHGVTEKLELVGQPDKKWEQEAVQGSNPRAFMFPHGQVHTGIQETVGGKDGGKSGPVMNPDTGALAETNPKDENASEPNRATQPSSGPTREELEQLTVDELRDLAAEREVDLHGASRKADIINRLAGDGDEE